MFMRHHVLSAGALCLAGAFLANAQVQSPPTEPPREATDIPAPRDEASPARAPAAADPVDAQIVSMLIHGDEHDIAMARAASARLQNAEVKKFADQLMQVHSATIKELQPFAAPQAIPSRATVDTEPESTKSRANDEVKVLRGNQSEVVTLEPAARAVRRSLDYAAVSTELRDEFIRLSKAELDAKDGRELDACFVGMVIASHHAALAKTNVLKRHASPALQQQLVERAKVMKSILEHAKGMMAQIDAAPATVRTPVRERLE